MIIEDELLNLKQIVLNLQTNIFEMRDKQEFLERSMLIMAKSVEKLEEESLDEAYDEMPVFKETLETGFIKNVDSKPIHVSLEDGELQDLEDRVWRGYN